MEDLQRMAAGRPDATTEPLAESVKDITLIDDGPPTYANTICIEGNIGSGKSTLISGLSRLGLNVHPEPVRQVWGKYLPILYGDPARWGMCFQMEVLDWFNSLQDNFEGAESKKYQSRRKASAKQSAVYTVEKKQNITKRGMSTIIERSPTSAYHIFSVNLYECGLLTEWEKSLLNRFYSITEWRPEYVIYLRTPPDCCCDRIRERSRKGEDQVNNELVNQLHHKHETLFYKKGRTNDKNIIVIDGAQSKENVLKSTVNALLKLGFEFKSPEESG